jgi:hypothetical protein
VTTYQAALVRTYSAAHKRLWTTPPKPKPKQVTPEPASRFIGRMSGRHILEVTAIESRIPMVHITGPRRERSLVIPRHAACILIRDLCPHLSFPAIGRIMGGRDHSTVMHALRVGPTRKAVMDLVERVRFILRAQAA